MKKASLFSRSASFIALATLLASSLVPIAAATGTPATPPAGSTFDQRLAQRKAEQNEQLNAQTQQHIQQTCVREQGNIRQLQSSFTNLSNTRTATYQKIDGLILISIGQLKLANVDTFTFEQDRAAWVQQVSAFQTTANNYQQTLGDLLVINCQADPVGFQALLDTARYYYQQLTTQSAGISTYIANTIQPIMQGFITQLQPKSNGN